MNYQHSFTVNATLQDVRNFHARSASMGAITPPPVIVQVHAAPQQLEEGDVMDFTLWLGPLPIHWVARIEETTPVSFVDRQLKGPFAAWEHLHTYVAQPDGSTIVDDRVTARFSKHPFWFFVGLGMWVTLPMLFAFRGWKTRRILEAEAVAQVGKVATVKQ